MFSSRGLDTLLCYDAVQTPEWEKFTMIIQDRHLMHHWQHQSRVVPSRQLLPSSRINIVSTCQHVDITVQLKAAGFDPWLRTSSYRRSFLCVWSHTGLRGFAIPQLSHAEAWLHQYQEGQCGSRQTVSPVVAFVCLFISKEKPGSGILSVVSVWLHQFPSFCLCAGVDAEYQSAKPASSFYLSISTDLNNLCASHSYSRWTVVTFFDPHLKRRSTKGWWTVKRKCRVWIQYRRHLKHFKNYRESWV